MPVDSRTALVSCLAGQRPGDLLGTAESAWVDFKSAHPETGPYDIRSDRGKFELAKDVAAFANAGGGLIVCGVKAAKRPTELYEAAHELKPFDRSLVRIDSYKDVVAEYVRPLLTPGYEWFDHPAGDGRPGGSYLVIDVPALPDAERWALVARGVDGNGRFVKGSWTVPIRSGDVTTYLPPDQVYQLLNDGLRSRRLPTVPKAPAEDPAPARTRLREFLGLDENAPMLFLQSTPAVPGRLLDGMYGAGGVRDALRHQQPLRSGGFNFASPFREPQTVDAGLVLASPPRRGIMVEPDGSATAAAAATGDMLGWAMENYSDGGGPRINVLVLTEVTLEYFRLVDQHVLALSDQEWTHRIVATGFAAAPALRLNPGKLPRAPHTGTAQKATTNHWNHAWSAHRSPEADAFEALRRLYPLFGLDVTDNPYVRNGRVSTDVLLGTLQPGAR